VEQFNDLYYMTGGSQCPHVHVEQGGKKMWICERTEGHDGPHDSVPLYLPRPRANTPRAFDPDKF
jgi:hypothetical protein